MMDCVAPRDLRDMMVEQGIEFAGAEPISRWIGFSPQGVSSRRRGFGLAVAAVIASGDSLLSGVHRLERGYDNVLEKSPQPGADIEAAQT